MLETFGKRVQRWVRDKNNLNTETHCYFNIKFDETLFGNVTKLKIGS